MKIKTAAYTPTVHSQRAAGTKTSRASSSSSFDALFFLNNNNKKNFLPTNQITQDDINSAAGTKIISTCGDLDRKKKKNKKTPEDRCDGFTRSETCSVVNEIDGKETLASLMLRFFAMKAAGGYIENT